MRFVESVLVGVPLFWFLFFVCLVATDTDDYFLPETGLPVAGQFYDGFGGVDDITNISEISLKDEFGRQPITNESGVLTIFSVPRQGWGFITTIITLEWNVLTLPMQEVAGQVEEPGVEIFNNLFWALFVVPSHMLLIFAFLFFIRSG